MTNLHARDLVARLNASGIFLWREGERLRYKAREQAMTDEVLAALKARKSELLEFFGRGDEEPIAPADKRAAYPASSQQRRLFALQQFEEAGVAYNIPSAYLLGRDVDVERIRNAARAAIQRHEALRTRFEIEDGELLQIVEDDPPFEVEVEDVDPQQIEARVRGFAQPFDLGKAPLLRVKILRCNGGESALLTDTHHIVSDGVSSEILIRDFGRCFAGAPLEPLRLQYRDYAVWQREGAGRALLDRQAEYWRGQFQGELPALELPADFPRPATRDFAGAVYETRLGLETSAALRALCRERGLSLYMVLLASYSALLARLSGREDVVVGNAVAGRDHAGFEGTIGLFVNTLAMRCRPESAKRCAAYLEEVKQLCLGALQNQQYPFEELIDGLDLQRDASRNPLFDTMLVVQNFERQGAAESLGPIRPYPMAGATSKFDLSVFAVESDGDVLLSFEYATSLFRETSIAALARRLKRVVESVARDPEQALGDIEILEAAERRHLLEGLNDTRVDYPLRKRVHEWFAEQAARAPDAIAVETGSERLSFRELDARSNRLARKLREEFGVGRELIVALMLDRSIEMIVGILGVLKAGGAYLPIDPTYPVDRIRFALDDSAPVLVLCQTARVGAGGFAGPYLDLESLDLSRGDGAPLSVEGSSRDLAYVIYTSGSTGRPKGTLCEHRGLVNRLLWMRDTYGIGAEDAILQKTTYTFDVSVWELLLPGMTGARLCFLEPDGEKDPEAIDEAIDAFGITTLHFVPSMLSTYLRWLPGRRVYPRLKRIICSGEALAPRHRDLFVEKLGEGVELHNLYGPTEASIDVTAFRVPPEGERIPIGRPVANTRLYVTDAFRRLIPQGVAGELCIGGVQLARGYLRREELTAERFVENPFSPGERLYRTGDLARWLPDGNLEYLGRIDNQVKLRGYRIELGEIEAAIARTEGVSEAVAAVVGDGDEAYLIAYYVSERELEPSELRAPLENALPPYMVPSRLVRIEALPLTTSGKVDRKALPTVDPEQSRETEFLAPRDDLEEAIADLWRETLKVERVGVRDSFFGLGGQSLKAVQLKRRIDDAFGTSLSLMSIVNGTVESLAGAVSQAGRPRAEPSKSKARQLARKVSSLIGIGGA